MHMARHVQRLRTLGIGLEVQRGADRHVAVEPAAGVQERPDIPKGKRRVGAMFQHMRHHHQVESQGCRGGRDRLGGARLYLYARCRSHIPRLGIGVYGARSPAQVPQIGQRSSCEGASKGVVLCEKSPFCYAFTPQAEPGQRMSPRCFPISRRRAWPERSRRKCGGPGSMDGRTSRRAPTTIPPATCASVAITAREVPPAFWK